MTDLTLQEYRDISDDKLKSTLRQEARKMFVPDPLKDYCGETADDASSYLQPNIQKNDRSFALRLYLALSLVLRKALLNQ